MRSMLLLALAIAFACPPAARAEDYGALFSGFGVTPEYVSQKMAEAEGERLKSGAANEVKTRLSDDERAKFARLAAFACSGSRDGTIFASRNVFVVPNGGGMICASKNTFIQTPSSLWYQSPQYTFSFGPDGAIRLEGTEYRLPIAGGEYLQAADLLLGSAEVQGALKQAISFWMAYEPGN